MASSKDYKCTYEIHKKCENSALCHLCDGASLYKNTAEEKAVKMAQREANREAERTALLKTHKQEKKEGMAFEKRVANKWNQHMSKTQNADAGLRTFDRKKKAVGRPRIDLSEIIESGSNEEQTSKVEEIISSGSIRPSFVPPPPPKPKVKKPVTEARRQANSGAMWHSKGDIKLDHALMECKERGSVTSRGTKTISIPKDWLDKQEKEAFQEQREYWYLPFGYKGEDDIYLIKPYDHELELIFELRKAREEIERLQELLKQKGIPSE